MTHKLGYNVRYKILVFKKTYKIITDIFFVE